MSVPILAGSTETILVRLKKADGSADPIPTGLTVTAGLVEHGELIAGPWTVDEEASGADWDNGVAVFELPGDDTKDLANDITEVDRELWVELAIELEAGKIKKRVADEPIALRNAGLAP